MIFATLKNPEAICVDFCASAVPPDETVQADQQYSSISFCFDQNGTRSLGVAKEKESPS